MTTLDDIRARAEAATEGPWSELDAQIRHTQIDGWKDPEGRRAAQEQTSADIDFVMHARTDIPKLLAALDAVLAVTDEHSEVYGNRYIHQDLIKNAIKEALEGVKA